jgi:hypothetical protein
MGSTWAVLKAARGVLRNAGCWVPKLPDREKFTLRAEYRRIARHEEWVFDEMLRAVIDAEAVEAMRSLRSMYTVMKNRHGGKAEILRALDGLLSVQGERRKTLALKRA